MIIQNKQTGGKGKFFLEQEGEVMAEMTYTMPAVNKMIIDHTEVDDELRGQNVGYNLVKASVEYARMNGIKIIPLCPFAKSIFDKRAELRDVL